MGFYISKISRHAYAGDGSHYVDRALVRYDEDTLAAADGRLPARELGMIATKLELETHLSIIRGQHDELALRETKY
jgi:hypothetical protein